MTVTLAEIEREVAARAAPFEDHTAAGGQANPAWISAQALVSSADVGDPYSGQWVLRRFAGADDRARRVVSYVPADGKLTLDRYYATAPSGGEPFEITPLDPVRHLRAGVLAGLARCFFVDRVAVPVTAGRVEEDLSAALFWITEVSQIRDVESRIGAAGVSRPTPLEWYRPVSSSAGVGVQVQAPTGGSYLIEALRPHATWVNGGDSPTGPTEDEDVLACPLEYAAAAGHVEVWRRARAVLAPVSSGSQRLAAPLSEAASTFDQIVRQQWWYWDRPDRVRVRYPAERSSQDEYVTTGNTWSGVAGRYTWRGLSQRTWAQVLAGG